MSIPITQLQNFCLKNALHLHESAQDGAIIRKAYRIPIDALLDTYTYRNIRDASDPNIKAIFEELRQQAYCGPALYTLELDTALTIQDILEKSEAYRAKVSVERRAISAIKKDPNTDAKTLYVGKVQKKFWERLVVHLGFATNRLTSGLQLFHWLRGTNSSVLINVYIFPASMKNLLSIIEVQTAHSLKPLMGKHS